MPKATQCPAQRAWVVAELMCPVKRDINIFCHLVPTSSPPQSYDLHMLGLYVESSCQDFHISSSFKSRRGRTLTGGSCGHDRPSDSHDQAYAGGVYRMACASLWSGPGLQPRAVMPLTWPRHHVGSSHQMMEELCLLVANWVS